MVNGSRMICSEGLSATILGLRPFFHAPQELPNSAQSFDPGNVHQERCALKGPQTERPNQAEPGSDGPICSTSQLLTQIFSRQ